MGVIPLYLNVLVYAHVSVGVFTRTPLFPIRFNFSADGWSSCGWMPDHAIPRLKGRANVLFLFFFFDWQFIFFGIDCELLHSTEYDYSFAMRLIPTVFFLLTRSGLIKILLGRTTANQALLCTSQLFLWV
jgi:hypothetical protein